MTFHGQTPAIRRADGTALFKAGATNGASGSSLLDRQFDKASLEYSNETSRLYDRLVSVATNLVEARLVPAWSVSIAEVTFVTNFTSTNVSVVNTNMNFVTNGVDVTTNLAVVTNTIPLTTSNVTAVTNIPLLNLWASNGLATLRKYPSSAQVISAKENVSAKTDELFRELKRYPRLLEGGRAKDVTSEVHQTAVKIVKTEVRDILNDFVRQREAVLKQYEFALTLIGSSTSP